MTRFVLVIIIWIIFLGGLQLYTLQKDRSQAEIRQPSPVEQLLEDTMSVELTPTFTAEADPFSLRTEGTATDPVRLFINGMSYPVPREKFKAGHTIRLEDIAPIRAGRNEVLITASPPLSDTMRQHAIRIALFRADTLLAERTVWAGNGELVSGTVEFTATEEASGHVH